MEPSEHQSHKIEKDIHRTFPKNEYFAKDGVGQTELRKVLRAYACYGNNSEYCQGMNFIVG